MIVTLVCSAGPRTQCAVERPPSIKKLMKLTPKTAACFEAGEEIGHPGRGSGAGDQVHVRPGGRIPTDGKVLAGSSTVNESMLTGESMPVAKGAGDKVFAGTIQQSGSFTFTATKVGSGNRPGPDIRLVEERRVQGADPAFCGQGRLDFAPTVVAICNNHVHYLVFLRSRDD